MDARVTMVDEVQDFGEVDAAQLRADIRDLENLSRLGKKARRDYYRARRQGLSNDAAMACARAAERKR
jgi:hypothetical protein